MGDIMNIQDILKEAPKPCTVLLGLIQIVQLKQFYKGIINPAARTFNINGRNIVPVNLENYIAYVRDPHYTIVESRD